MSLVALTPCRQRTSGLPVSNKAEILGALAILRETRRAQLALALAFTLGTRVMPSTLQLYERLMHILQGL